MCDIPRNHLLISELPRPDPVVPKRINPRTLGLTMLICSLFRSQSTFAIATCAASVVFRASIWARCLPRQIWVCRNDVGCISTNSALDANPIHASMTPSRFFALGPSKSPISIQFRPIDSGRIDLTGDPWWEFELPASPRASGLILVLFPWGGHGRFSFPIVRRLGIHSKAYGVNRLSSEIREDAPHCRVYRRIGGIRAEIGRIVSLSGAKFLIVDRPTQLERFPGNRPRQAN